MDRNLMTASERLPLMNAVSPRLDAFRARGGKLLMSFGWADNVASARTSSTRSARWNNVAVDKTEPATAVPAPDGTKRKVQAITGPALFRAAGVKPGTASRPLGVLSYLNPCDAATLDPARYRLLAVSSETRSGQVGPTAEIPPADWAFADWAFADCSATPFPASRTPGCCV